MPVRRRPLAVAAVLAATLGAALAAPAPAPARIVELGQLAQAAQPSCPATPCLAVSRTTGYQVKVGTERDLFVVPEDGKIVAWSITLSQPGPSQVRFFERNLGGAAAARITILRTGERSYGRVTGQSAVQRLEPYFGSTVQFPLGRTLNVRKGYVVALTVPTWAPALAVGFGGDVSWRASRDPEDCGDTRAQTAQRRLGQLARYRCRYSQARLAYSATLVTRPQPTGAGSR